jgi:predicted nicotinamide N-methyase
VNTEVAAAFVLAHATLREVPLVPEIRLHLADDAISVWEASERHAGPAELPPPFWAFAWPGGQALARHLLDHPELVAGRSVLDLGSGSGITAIAAALAGAASVLASEVDPVAVTAIGMNAAVNGTRIAVTGDVLGGSGEGAEVILAADVWYERDLADRALALLCRARELGSQVIVGDIGRAFLPRTMLTDVAAYDVQVQADIEDADVKRALILTLSGGVSHPTRPGAGTRSARR